MLIDVHELFVLVADFCKVDCIFFDEAGAEASDGSVAEVLH